MSAHKDMIDGQVIVRPTRTRLDDGRVVTILLGVLAVPEDHELLQPDTGGVGVRFEVMGRSPVEEAVDPEQGETTLRFGHATREPLEERYAGWTFEELLTGGMEWRARV